MENMNHDFGEGYLCKRCGRTRREANDPCAPTQMPQGGDVLSAVPTRHSTEAEWKCSECGVMNATASDMCSYCGHRRNEVGSGTTEAALWDRWKDWDSTGRNEVGRGTTEAAASPKGHGAGSRPPSAMTNAQAAPQTKVRQPDDAIRALLAIVRDQLYPMADELIEREFRSLQTAWGSQDLYGGTMEELMPILTANFERIGGEPGFRYFDVYCDRAKGHAGVMASFPQTVVPVRIWRGRSKLYVCGNSLFASGRVTMTAGPTKNGQLLSVASKGDLDSVKDWIDEGADVNARGYLGSTPLMAASAGGHAEVAEFLIKAGADVDARDNEGRTPLMKAAASGHAAVAEALIKAGANVNVRPIKGATDANMALHSALDRDLTALATLFIERGADITEVAGRVSALAQATGRRNPAIVKLLLGRGAVIDERTVEFANDQKRVHPMPEIRGMLENAIGQAKTAEIKKVISGWRKRWWQF